MDSKINDNNLFINNNENLHIKINTADKVNNFVSSKKDYPDTISSRKILESASLSITKIVTEKEYSREKVGGKGAALYRMQQAGMQVPKFVTIDVNSTNNLEQQILNITSIKPFINDIENFDLSTVNIFSIKQVIQTYYTDQLEKRNKYLQCLANFIASNAFYHQIANLEVIAIFRENYNQLIAKLPKDSAIIVRSSGIKEDNYGNAQASKFESLVHGKQDIIRTCLQVLASGFQPHVCPVSAPQPMALIMQKCIDCEFGGVAMSRASQNDSRGKIEFVPGQPKGGVSGLEGVTPHCYLISQQNNKFIYEFIEGNITTQFVLNQQGTNNFAEQSIAVNLINANLTDAQLQQIYQYLQQGEDILLCPADIEFAIAKDGTVYIVQLRPLTVLTGGLNFATEPPTDHLATGTLVSEGFCSGNLFYINNPKIAETVPQGAIVVTKHGKDWMLNNSFLNKVGGFIFEQGGTNDHVAITLRQKEKPCLIVKDNFTELKNKSVVVTLACCNFNGSSSAYVVHGSEFANKLATMKSEVKATYDRSSATPTTKTSKLTFDRPDIAFKNLHDLNYILLDYFSADSWLTRCFTEKSMLLLSMAPHRIEIIKEARQEIQQMFADFALFLQGYKQYLQLGIKLEINDTNFLQQNLVELKKLTNIFEKIKIKVNDDINKISQQFIALTNQIIYKGDFQQLLQKAANIFANTQKLNSFNFFEAINNIKSIHDIIFFIHKRFIEALVPVTISSSLGIVNKHGNVISILFSNTREQQLIEKLCVDSLSYLNLYDKPTVVIMENTIIAAAKLGAHACTIEMLEQAEAGKERTLKLKLSDNFKSDGYYQGKLKRFYFLTQILHNIGFADDSSGMQVSVEEATEVLAIEITHIQTKKIIMDKFSKLISALNSMKDLDMKLESLSFTLESIYWNFSVLKQKIYNLCSLENQQYFNHMFIILCCRYNSEINKFSYANKNKVYHLFQLIVNLNSDNNLELTDIQNLLNNIEPINQEKLLYDLLITNITIIIQLVKIKYPNWFANKEKIIQQMFLNGLLLKYASNNLCNDPDVVLTAIRQNIKAIKYTGKKLFNNNEFILNLIKCIKKTPLNRNFELSDVPNEIKNHKDIMSIIAIYYPKYVNDIIYEFQNDENMLLNMIKKSDIIFCHLIEDLQDNKKFILKAIKENYRVYEHIGDKLQNDKEILQAYKELSKHSKFITY